jgi:hypothetical protein
MDGPQVRGAVITFVDITERKRAADALQKAKDELELRVAERTRELSVALGQLRELAAYSEQVREEERTRIAREVHDELGSLLVALKMDVNWLDKRLAEQQSREAEAAQAMRERMRSKCQNMSRLIENRGGQRGPHHHRPAPQHPGPPGPVGRAGVAGARVRAVGRAGAGLPRCSWTPPRGAARTWAGDGGVPHLPGDAVQRGPPQPGAPCAVHGGAIARRPGSCTSPCATTAWARRPRPLRRPRSLRRDGHARAGRPLWRAIDD